MPAGGGWPCSLSVSFRAEPGKGLHRPWEVGLHRGLPLRAARHGHPHGLALLWPKGRPSTGAGPPPLCRAAPPGPASPHRILLVTRQFLAEKLLLVMVPGQSRRGRDSEDELISQIRCAGPWGRGGRPAPGPSQLPAPPGAQSNDGEGAYRPPPHQHRRHHGNQGLPLSTGRRWNQPWDSLAAGRALDRGPWPLHPGLSHWSGGAMGRDAGFLPENGALLIRDDMSGTGQAARRLPHAPSSEGGGWWRARLRLISCVIALLLHG